MADPGNDPQNRYKPDASTTQREGDQEGDDSDGSPTAETEVSENADDLTSESSEEVLTGKIVYIQPATTAPTENNPLEENMYRLPTVSDDSRQRTSMTELPDADLIPTRSILISRQYLGSLVPETPVYPEDIQMHYSSDKGIFRFYKTRTKDSNHKQLPKTEAFIYMVIPPDGGYAWIVLVVAFCCHIIVDGLLYSIGSILPAIANDLNVNSKQTALIASAQIAPASGAFINKFGFRPVAVTGALVASTAILIASFSRRIAMLIVFQGVLAGISLGMIYMATSLIINYYFERYRAVVCGLASAGSGVGMIVMNLLNVNLVENVGWSNTLRVHTFLIFVTGIMTLAYRPVEPTKLGQYIELHSDTDIEESFEIVTHRYSVATIKGEVVKSVKSLVATARIEGRLIILEEPRRRSLFSRVCPWCATQVRRFSSPGVRKILIRNDPLDRWDIFYDSRPDYNRVAHVSLKDMDGIELETGSESKARTITYTFSLIRAAPPHEEEKKSCCPVKIKSAFDALLDLGLLNLPEFRLIILESFLFPMGYNIPYVYSVERAEIDNRLAHFLPVGIGITNIVFRLIVGLLAFKIRCHTAYISGCGMVIGGLVTLLSAFVGQSTIWFQFLFVICFGLGTASYSAARAIVYVKVLGLDKLTNAFGLTTMVMGLGAFIGTSIAGAMNDYFEGYTVTFAFSGIAMIMAGCLKLILPKYVRHRKRLEAKGNHKRVHFAVGATNRKWYEISSKKKTTH